MDINERLKYYRKLNNLSQEELAEKANINEKYYGRIEREESIPTINVLRKICKALNISLIEFFLPVEFPKSNLFKNQRQIRILCDSWEEGIGIHFNNDIIVKDCEKTIWYCGYIGSILLDEYEMKFFAVGNIKGKLYMDYKLILEVNGESVSDELRKYFANDKELEKICVYSDFDESTLKEMNGDAFFICESNWLTAQLIDNNTVEIIDEIILDYDNIFECFNSRELFFKTLFK